MPKKVAVIDLVVSIKGIGTVICLPKEEFWSLAPTEAIHRRERIQIRKPDGSCVPTFVKGVESVNRGMQRGSVALALPRPISPEDVPNGSELWLEGDGSEPLLEDE